MSQRTKAEGCWKGLKKSINKKTKNIEKILKKVLTYLKKCGKIALSRDEATTIKKIKKT